MNYHQSIQWSIGQYFKMSPWSLVYLEGKIPTMFCKIKFICLEYVKFASINYTYIWMIES